VPNTGYVSDVVKTFANFIETAIKVPWRAVALRSKSAPPAKIAKSQKVQH
jgi:isoleucyl-tRNA synthetase